MKFTYIYPITKNLILNYLLQLLAGNTNTYTEVKQMLEPPIVGSKIRFIPHSVHVRTVCMRVEILGCKWLGKHKDIKLVNILIKQMNIVLNMKLFCYRRSYQLFNAARCSTS